MSWTEARIAALVKLWDRGRSASAIAAELETTRDAVLGKVKRLGLNRSRAVQPPRSAPAPRTGLTLPRRAAAPGARRAILALEDGACRWPMGEIEAPDFRFCGRKAEAGRPYCAAHGARACQRPRPAKKTAGAVGGNEALYEWSTP